MIHRLAVLAAGFLLVAILAPPSSGGDWGEPLRVEDRCEWMEIREHPAGHDDLTETVTIFWGGPGRTNPIGWQDEGEPIFRPGPAGTIAIEWVDFFGVRRRVIALSAVTTYETTRLEDYWWASGLRAPPQQPVTQETD